MKQHHTVKSKEFVKLIELALLIAIMLLMETTGLGMIKTAALEITLLLVPVIIGAIVLGPIGGTILGAVFGFISFWECFGKSPFGSMLMSINPFYTFLVCVPTRTLMGLLCGLIFRGMERIAVKKNLHFISYVVAALSGALLNTAFFMSVLCLCFYHTEYIQGFVSALGSPNVFYLSLHLLG